MALEAVLVSTLLLAHLAVPSELAQALRLDAIPDRLWGEETVLRHNDVLSLAVSVKFYPWGQSILVSVRGSGGMDMWTWPAMRCAWASPF